MKKCNKCEIEKELSQFKRYSVCIDCNKILNKIYNDSRKEKMKEYYQESKELFKDKAKLYYQENKEYIIHRNSNYYEDNKSKMNTYKNEYRKNKMMNDPVARLKHNIRSLISQSFRKNGYSKGTITSNILLCSYEEFRNYIENLFKDGMSWENYGEWHLDHKTPISWAETEDQVYELNRYTNFQPLWEFDNLSKGNRYSN